ncbi:MAG: M12 family metallo-peptidase [Gammaproteobacteria bacterium]|nr:M12 family metallo-peptidase [Gammaproteobacteria bacterium]
MDKYTRKYLVALAAFMVLPQSLMAEPLWSDLSSSDKTAIAVSVQSKLIDPHKNSRRVSVSFDQLKATLAPAATLPAGQSAKTVNTSQIDLPMPYGGLQTFNVYESSVMEPELAAKYPEIQSYKVVAVNDPTVTGVLDTGPNGFHAYLNTAEGEMFIDPVSKNTQQEYYSLYKHDYASTTSREFSCGVKSKSAKSSPVAEFMPKGVAALARTSDNLISYRIAVATTGEYSQAIGGTATNVLNEVVTAIGRVSFIYERDLAIRLSLVSGTNLIFMDPATDGYTNASASSLLTENQAKLDSLIGSANYDIGHVFSTGGGGLAGLGVACNIDSKAHGETGSPDPTGDLFYIDYVAHEIGHQLGANHTFNGTTNSCGYGNRNGSTAFEPGSGSTIMAYAGICGVENSSTASIATFHAGSIEEIIAYSRNGGGNTCSTPSIASSLAPVANAGPDYTIPGGTAFTLTGSAIDTDVLTYQWDQMDAGYGSTSTSYGTDYGSNALFRSFLPDASPSRTFPQMSTLLSNVADKAETLPIEARTLNFRFTARDDTGGVHEDDMQVIVDGAASGPFKILQPNGGEILKAGSPQLIEWNKACTDQAPVNCATVDILLSTDSGATFPTVLAAATANDGAHPFTFTGTTATARIKIACTDNVFFDVSDGDFLTDVTYAGILTTSNTPETCGTATGNVVFPDGNDTQASADSLTLPANLSSTVHDALDYDDYFVFVATASTYTITLSNYANNDLDLYLLDSGGGVLAASESWTDPTEIITHTNFVVGNTYYVVVNAWDTAGQDSTYTLDIQETVPPVVSGGGGGGTLSYYWLFMLLITPLLRCRLKD